MSPSIKYGAALLLLSGCATQQPIRVERIVYIVAPSKPVAERLNRREKTTEKMRYYRWEKGVGYVPADQYKKLK
jgi:type IV pilus biogenesis protein CpaD/CtpE